MSKSGFIAIVGRPNSGKSTLLNALLGTNLSIVTPKAQTTRERVLGILTESRGQIVFIDTPGIHRAKEGGINEFMVQEAREALDGPSCVWYLVDPRTMLEHEKPVLEMLRKSGSPVFVLMNKSDLVSKLISGGGWAADRWEKLETEVVAEARKLEIPVERVQRISGEKKSGLEELIEASWKMIPEGPPYFPDEEQISDRPTRFFVSEKIREQLYLQLGEEIPYSCGVEIENFDENAKPLRIEAVIFVERESQKGMVVGKGGTKIKDIGTSARKQIEEFLGQKIFLGLKVKLLKDWTRDAELMKRIGYGSSSGRGR